MSALRNVLHGLDMDLYLASMSTPKFTGGGLMELFLDFGDGSPRKWMPRMLTYLAGGVSGNLKPLWTDFLAESLAGNLWHKWGGDLFDPILTGGGLYILESFYYCDDIVERTIPYFESFMLDSGAFTFFSSGKKVEWDEYIGRYCDFINRNDVSLFFELDIDALIGYEKVKTIRKRIERETGKQPIPVWHKRLGKDEFFKMCDEYPYVAIGGIVSKEITQKEYKFFPWFIDEAHKRGCKIHGLGFTNMKGLERYHFDSVDSTAWLSGNRFGAIYEFTGKTMIKHDKGEGQKLSDSRAVAVHNFSEWVKFQQYAKNHL